MRLVVFDMDGTLLDSEATITSRVTRAFEGMGLAAPDIRTIRANVGLSLPLYMSRVSGITDETTIAGLVGRYREIAHADPEGMMPLFAGARKALERLRADPGTVLGIATGKGRAGVDRALAQNDLEGWFDTIQTADGHPSKPHPAMLQAAMAEVGADAGQTVMIGDAVLDVLMAVAAAVPCIGVTWGLQDPGELAAAGAAALIESFDALDDTIGKVLEPRHA